MFRGLNPAQAPQGLQMNWQPNIGGGNEDPAQAMQGLGSAADMLQQWLASRRKGIALPHRNGGPDMHTGGGMQLPSHEA